MTLTNKIAYYFDFLRPWNPSRIIDEQYHDHYPFDRDLGKRIMKQQKNLVNDNRKENHKLLKQAHKLEKQGKYGQALELLMKMR